MDLGGGSTWPDVGESSVGGVDTIVAGARAAATDDSRREATALPANVILMMFLNYCSMYLNL